MVAVPKARTAKVETPNILNFEIAFVSILVRTSFLLAAFPTVEFLDKIQQIESEASRILRVF